MLQTWWATVERGTIRLAEGFDLPEGTRLLVTVLPDGVLPDADDHFWQGCSQTSLEQVWDNTEDDAYAQLLEE